MASEPSDDIPPTPRNATSAQDTERDLVPPSRERAAGDEALETTLDVTTTLGNSTLLSVKAAAERGSDRPDPLVDELERRLSQLEARLKVLELERGAGPSGDKRWLFWVGLLLALVLGWQLRAWLR
ncbi:MAG: hypothetical protein IT375_30130 [Polyangiaceae bacterium]|nr:hypothetical protein [Polyangiaceae bacterium]